MSYWTSWVSKPRELVPTVGLHSLTLNLEICFAVCFRTLARHAKESRLASASVSPSPSVLVLNLFTQYFSSLEGATLICDEQIELPKKQITRPSHESIDQA